jgi:hypothetical protein
MKAYLVLDLSVNDIGGFRNTSLESPHRRKTFKGNT